MASNLSPYEPFLGEYKKPPSLMKGPDLGVNEKTGSGEEFLRMHSSFMRPRLLNKRNSHQGIERINQQFQVYWNDLFHTLLNMPRYRFIAIFFAVYLMEYVIFAMFYVFQSDECLAGVHHFSHAMWFSVQTAATIGYGGELAPNPECTMLNMMVVFQVIFAALVDYLMMGLVFARFAAPSRRTATIRFSESAVVHQHASGYWCISMRLANIRKHTLVQPEVQMLMAVPDSASQSTFQFEELAVEKLTSQLANLKLGLPAIITHVIDPSSPLYHLTLNDIEAKDMELVVFMDGIDAMTSNNMSARYSYYFSDLRLNHTFSTIYLRATRKGKVGLDLSEFDATLPSGVSTFSSNTTLRNKSFAQLAKEAQGAGAGSPTAGQQQKQAPPQPYYQQQVYRLSSESDVHLPIGAPSPGISASGARQGETRQLLDKHRQVKALVASLLADPTANEVLKRQAQQLQAAL